MSEPSDSALATPTQTAPDGLPRVAVLGAGLMGSGIAAAAVAGGHEVRIFDPIADSLERSRERLETALARMAKRAEDPEALAGATERASWTGDLGEALSGAGIAIEAAPEDEALKLKVFDELGHLAEPDAILATNTSSIPVGRLARVVEDRERVLGLHFFSPVEAMPLVEIVVALDTAPAAVERAHAFCTGIGKHPIEVKDRAGFVVNRLLVPLLLAAVRMVQDGDAEPEAVDAGLKLGAGHPMGPLRLIDSIGADVVAAAAERMYAEYGSPEYMPPPLLARMVDAGRLGRKTGRGFYEYG